MYQLWNDWQINEFHTLVSLRMDFNNCAGPSVIEWFSVEIKLLFGLLVFFLKVICNHLNSVSIGYNIHGTDTTITQGTLV